MGQRWELGGTGAPWESEGDAGKTAVEAAVEAGQGERQQEMDLEMLGTEGRPDPAVGGGRGQEGGVRGGEVDHVSLSDSLQGEQRLAGEDPQEEGESFGQAPQERCLARAGSR